MSSPPTLLQTCEVFGPTIQGEGPFAGQQCMFIRTQTCPVQCVWCDSKMTWDSRPNSMRTIDGLVSELNERAGGVRLVIVTGGEPFVHAKEVAELTAKLNGSGWSVQFETSGTFVPSPKQLAGWAVDFIVSPKPPSAQAKVLPNMEAIEWFVDNGAYFKFVIKDQNDLNWAKEFVRAYHITDSRVWLMPEGMTPPQIQQSLQFIWSALRQFPSTWKVSGRLHIDAWGPKRGV